MTMLPFSLQALRSAVRREVETALVDGPARAGERPAGSGAGRRAGPQPARSVAAAPRRAAAGERGDGDFAGPAGDPGLFGIGSATWRVHGDLPSMLVGGIAALLLQTLHPLAMAGVAEHSAYRSDPLGRLRRTAQFVAVTTFGSTAAADRAIDRVRAVHRRVRGVAPDGRPYDASDPELLTWVHVSEVHCFLRAYRRFGPAPLGSAEGDRYVAEMASLARRLGASAVPETVAEVGEYFRAVRPELRAGAQALSGAAFIVNVGGRSLPPSTLAAASVRAVLVQAAIGLVPRWAATMLGLRQPLLAERLAQRAAAEALLGTLRWVTAPSPALVAARARCLAVPVSVSAAGGVV